jgi:hypothetical protein
MKIKSDKSAYLIFFLLHPFLTLIHYLANFKKPEAKNVMWLFTIFYSAVFAIGTESQNSDINHYIQQISIFNSMDFDTNGVLQYFYSSGEFDFLTILLSFLVSYFTDNGYYLIIMFGVLFGYFYSRNMWYVLDRLEGNTKTFTRILIFCLFLIVPIWFLNGFRFWTAAHVFLFGLLPYLLEGKKKSLIWCFLNPFLFHYSFIIPLIPLVIYLLLGNKIKYYFILFIVTFFISNFDVNQINNIALNYIPNILIERSDSYLAEEKVDSYRNSKKTDTRRWYVKYYSQSLRWVLVLLLIYIYLNYKFKIQKNNNHMYFRLLGFIFLLTSFANVISTIPSGSRFLSVTNLLSVTFIVLIYQNYNNIKKFKRLTFFATPFLLFFVIVSLRVSWYTLSLMSIIGNPLSAIFTFGDNFSINDIIKGL